MLSIEQLEFCYAATDTNKAQPMCFDLTVNAGEVLSLIGPSGSGKSTLLKLIAGFNSTSNGSIEINGQSVSISFPETTKEGQKYQVNYQTADVYPGNSVPSSRSKLPEGEWISGDHLVHRLRLGSFELTPESAELAIIAAENPGVIGIDQIILTKTKAE